jgi:hypothetical protein
MTTDAAPVPVHLGAALDGLAENPALPADFIRRLIAYRRGLGHVAMRADLTADLIAEIIATDYHWLLHSLALNRTLPQAVRISLARHRDGAVRAALVSRDQHTPEDPFEQWLNDPTSECVNTSRSVKRFLTSFVRASRTTLIRKSVTRWRGGGPRLRRKSGGSY